MDNPPSKIHTVMGVIWFSIREEKLAYFWGNQISEAQAVSFLPLFMDKLAISWQAARMKRLQRWQSRNWIFW